MPVNQNYEVVWPLGVPMAQDVPPTEPVMDLGGKTIALLWNDLFRGDEIFAIVKEQVRSEFPDVAFVEPREFGNIHGHDEETVIAQLPDVLFRYKVDAALIGVGG